MGALLRCCAMLLPKNIWRTPQQSPRHLSLLTRHRQAGRRAGVPTGTGSAKSAQQRAPCRSCPLLRPSPSRPPSCRWRTRSASSRPDAPRSSPAFRHTRDIMIGGMLSVHERCAVLLACRTAMSHDHRSRIPRTVRSAEDTCISRVEALSKGQARRSSCLVLHHACRSSSPGLLQRGAHQREHIKAVAACGA